MTTFESLEPRRFLAADLTAVLSTYTLPANQKAGTALKGSATLLISNKDAKALPASTKKVTATFFLRTPGSPDLLIGTAKNISLTGLAKSKPAKSVPVSLSLPKTVRAGTFSLVAVVDSAKAVPESNENNNTATSPKKFTLKPATTTGNHPGSEGADLIILTSSTSLHPDGSNNKYSVTIKNIGDATSTPFHYSVVATAPGRDDQLLDQSDFFFPTLAPDKTYVLTDSPLPSITNHNDNATEFAIQFRITAGDTHTINNTSTIGHITLPGTPKFATPSNGENPVLNRTGSPSLSFVSTSHTENSATSFDDQGTVTDGQGRTGTYEYKSDGFLPPSLHIDLYDAVHLYFTDYLDFGYGTSQTPPPFTTLNGKVLNFSSTSNTNAIASASDFGGGTTLFITLA